MPPIVIREVVQDGDNLRLVYDRPGEGFTPGTHAHVVPLGALVSRTAWYGTATAADALEECVHEMLATTDPDRHPTKESRVGSRGNNGVVGLATALRKAGITLPEPKEEDVIAAEDAAIRVLGRERFAAMRGVPVADVPDVIAGEETRDGTGAPTRGPLRRRSRLGVVPLDRSLRT